MNASLALLLDPFACIAFGKGGADGKAEKAVRVVIVPTALRSRTRWQFYSAERWPAERRKVLEQVASSERLGDFIDLEAVLRGPEKEQRIPFLSALLKQARASCAIEGVEWKELHVFVPSYVAALLSTDFKPVAEGSTETNVTPALLELKLKSTEFDDLERDLGLAAAHAGFERTTVSPNYFHAARAACHSQELQAKPMYHGCVVEVGLSGIGFLPFSLQTGIPTQGDNLQPAFLVWDIRSFLFERIRDAVKTLEKTLELVSQAEIAKDIAEELFSRLPARLFSDRGHNSIDVTVRGESFVLSSDDPVFGVDWAPLNDRIRLWLSDAAQQLIPNRLVERLTAAGGGQRHFLRYTLSGSLASLPRMEEVLHNLVCADPKDAPRDDDLEKKGPLGILDHKGAHAVLGKLPMVPIARDDSPMPGLSNAASGRGANGQRVYTAVKVGPARGGGAAEEKVVRDNMTQPLILLYDAIAPAPAQLDSSRSWAVEIPVTLFSGLHKGGSRDEGVSREFRVVFRLMPWNLGQRLEVELRVLPSHRALLTASTAGVPAAVDVVPVSIPQLERFHDSMRADLRIDDASSLVRCIELGRFEITASPLHKRLTDALDAGEISHSLTTTATE